MTRLPSALRALRAAAPGFVLLLLLPAAIVVFAGCGDDAGDPTPGQSASTLSFTVNDSVHVAFEGEAAWPPSGTGVIARMDSAGTTLAIAAYQQTSGKGAPAGPEPRFTFAYFLVEDSAGIAAGPYLPDIALFAIDIPLSGLDSLAYFGVYGSFVVTAIEPGAIRGTFSGVGVRSSDSAAALITAGLFDAALSTGSLSFGDTGSTGGTIAITVGTGTTPTYGWTGGNVYGLAVSRASAPSTPVWAIVTAGEDSIATGVTHGTVPAGASLLAGSEPVLTAGVAYRLTVSRTNGEYGYVTFTR